ncbi:MULTISPECIES: prephenate dehydrogenase [Bacillus]|uniref:prephenate dehydrogenase n=1 Tax=Bacillus TaxID=1386 RepID=UPI001FBA5806|nr:MULTISPECIES: prephenate dehydrogenase [Bacillus]MCJ2146186.1 prephenate dehydrogenase [Bacillus sp. B19-2]MDN5386109.1 prephenate dehydrogenase [Bacillus sp. LB7]MEC1022211.1 prephenate dehydrogenase [Bacillus paralicheniformis]MEC1025523.1 prephenate dehydrogenase [Bacillus paralicheniformis]MEC1035059.1 prephenate dehydrogenase [Bacillus paralicheniformis]
MTQPNETILLAGLGLIGGSIALAIKKEHPGKRIIGFDVSEEQARAAQKLGVIDAPAASFLEGVKEASTVFLAAPVEQTLHMLDELAASGIKKKLLITDVGSTKQKVVSHAEKVLPDEYRFIGGHPMAGSHKSGVAAAKDFLFENAFYILTPSGSAGKEAVASLKDLLKGTNAKFVEMSPAEHDAVTSVISHFPHVVAASLVHQTVKFEDQYPLVKRFAAGGFRDITRIASSSPAMWRDILLHNKDKILERFDEWKYELDRIQSFVENEDADGLFEFFRQAKEYRDGLPLRQKGAIPSFYDLYVDVPDHPGVISEITAILADEKISITNIRIIETREDINGVLRISFQSDEDRKRAEKCIQTRAKYETFYAD